MPDDPKTTEGGQEPASQGLPIPKLEQASAASATSSVDTKALAKEVAELLRPDFEKVAQSTKDKRIAKLEKRLGVSDLEELEEMGVQIPDSAKMEYRLRQLEGGRSQPDNSAQPPASPGNGATLTAQEVQEVISKYKLDANDAEVLDKLNGKTYRSRDHFENTLANLAWSRATQAPPSPGATTTLPGSQSRSTLTDADAELKYTELRGLYKSPSLNAAKINVLQKELRDAGRPVD